MTFAATVAAVSGAFFLFVFLLYCVLWFLQFTGVIVGHSFGGRRETITLLAFAAVGGSTLSYSVYILTHRPLCPISSADLPWWPLRAAKRGALLSMTDFAIFPVFMNLLWTILPALFELLFRHWIHIPFSFVAIPFVLFGLIFMIGWVICGFRIRRFRCPRCQNYFFGRWFGWLIALYWSSCRYCGLKRGTYPIA